MTIQVKFADKGFRAGLLVLIALSLWQTPGLVHAQASPASVQDQPFVVEYYYKAKWGYAEEFLQLFLKNHYPLLKQQLEIGNALQVVVEAPIHHGTEDGRWDYRVRIVWKNVQTAHDDSGDEAILKKLLPDQETFQREEQRRFEILIAHWDVPVKAVNLDAE